MGQAAKAREQDRKARARLRVLRHHEQVTRNVSQTCRFFGISRSLFYVWRDRYQQDGLAGLRDGPRGPRPPFTTPAHIVALMLQVRRQRQYGPLRISFFLQRYHQVYVSPPTIQRILKRDRVPQVSLKSYRPGPRRRREIHVPGQSVQVMSSISNSVAGAFTNSRPSMRPHAIACFGSMRTTPSSRPRSSPTKCAAACRWPSNASRRTMAPSLGPIHLASAGSRRDAPADSPGLPAGQWQSRAQPSDRRRRVLPARDLPDPRRARPEAPPMGARIQPSPAPSRASRQDPGRAPLRTSDRL